MRKLAVLFWMLLALHAGAQNCRSLLRKADRSSRHGHYARAIELYSKAIECNPAKAQVCESKIVRAARRLAFNEVQHNTLPPWIPSRIGRAAYNQALFEHELQRDSLAAWAIARYNLLHHVDDASAREAYALISASRAVWPQHSKTVICTGHRGAVNDVIFSPDGQFILTAGVDSSVRIWDMEGHETQRITLHKSKLSCMALSPDGQYLVTGGRDHTAMLIPGQKFVRTPVPAPKTSGLVSPHYGELTHEKELAIQLPEHKGSVSAAAFSPDGARFVTADKSGQVRMWNLQGKLVEDFPGQDMAVWSVVFSPPQGEPAAVATILTAGSDKIAKLWDMSGKLLVQFVGHESMISCAIFSPDGKFVLTASGDSTVRLWDLHGNQRRHFTGHADAVWSAAFSPDGKYLLTGSWDKTARLWNAQTGRLLETFAGHTGPIYSVAFSPDGEHIATASTDGTARIWKIGQDCLECQLNIASLRELQQAGVQLEPEDIKWLNVRGNQARLSP